uniref:Uncharacterized protein n=1 Tax=Salix viminalis TaxID=40686 RepID=A0A6N2M308_SALVM
MEMVEVGEVGDVMTTEKTAEIAMKGYAEYVEQWENAIAKCSGVLVFFDS